MCGLTRRFLSTKRACLTRATSTIGWRCLHLTRVTGSRVEADQCDPFETVSLMYDDRRLLETRVRRLSDPRIYSQEPRSRTSRTVTNVSIEPDADEHGVTVRSKFVLIEYRREDQRLFAGTSFHRLVGEGDAMRIAMKKVELINCDAPLDGLVVPF